MGSVAERILHDILFVANGNMIHIYTLRVGLRRRGDKQCTEQLIPYRSVVGCSRIALHAIPWRAFSPSSSGSRLRLSYHRRHHHASPHVSLNVCLTLVKCNNRGSRNVFFAIAKTVFELKTLTAGRYNSVPRVVGTHSTAGK